MLELLYYIKHLFIPLPNWLSTLGSLVLVVFPPLIGTFVCFLLVLLDPSCLLSSTVLDLESLVIAPVLFDTPRSKLGKDILKTPVDLNSPFIMVDGIAYYPTFTVSNRARSYGITREMIAEHTLYCIAFGHLDLYDRICLQAFKIYYRQNDAVEIPAILRSTMIQLDILPRLGTYRPISQFLIADGFLEQFLTICHDSNGLAPVIAWLIRLFDASTTKYWLENSPTWSAYVQKHLSHHPVDTWYTLIMDNKVPYISNRKLDNSPALSMDFVLHDGTILTIPSGTKYSIAKFRLPVLAKDLKS